MHRLQNRGIIKISGPDAAQFLHNMTTNNVLQMQTLSSIYNLILNSKGRYLFDFFLIKHETHFYLDCSKEDIEPISELLRQYRMLLKVKIKTCSEYFVAVDTDKCIGDMGYTVMLEDNITMFQDPRCEKLGVRYIVPVTADPGECTLQDQETYDRLLMKNTVPDCVKCMIRGESFPLHFGLGKLHAISNSKGCYMGQEVVARMHRAGVKKMLFTIIADSNAMLPSEISEVIYEGKPIGNMVASSGSIGLCVLEVEKVPEGQKSLQVAGKSVVISNF